MIFWIGAAVIIFVCSLIWAFISMRSVMFDEDQQKETVALPPQPAIKSQLPSAAALPLVSEPATDATVQHEQPRPTKIRPELTISQIESSTTDLPQADQPMKMSLSVGDSTPSTIEEARMQLQAAIKRANGKQKPTQAVIPPPVSAIPKKITKTMDTIEARQLGNFLGEIKIQTVRK